jgi:hypothetical protein
MTMLKVKSKLAIGVAVIGLAGCGEASPEEGVDKVVLASGFHIDPYRSVLVRDVGVVDDPARTQDPCLSTSSTSISQKYWFFGYLLTQMANGSTATAYSDFARSWLRSWETSTTLNNDPLVAVRPASGASTKPLATRIREAWQRKSGSATLAMNRAPFRLLAIVNRFDLRKSPRRFGEGASGELRFVFSPLDLDNGCEQYANPVLTDKQGEQLVILEYAVDISTPEDQRNWIVAWTALTDHAPGTPEFNEALQTLTQRVVTKGKGGSRPNGSALIRIRTNETADDVRWDLREFNINASTHLVVPTVVKQTPRDSLNCTLPFPQPACSNDLGLWMKRNSSAILADTYVVPDQFPARQGYSTTSFRGSHSTNQVANTFWVGGTRDRVDPEVRHQFSKNTCSGCHSAETGTAFFHVHGRAKGEVAALSPFLTGYQCGGSMTGCGEEIYGEPHCIADPVSGQQRCFGELDDRVSDILSYLNSGI